MKSAIYMKGKRFVENSFKYEEDFEKIVKNSSKTLFGQKTVYFDLKSKIETKTLGASIPDGFLFDFNDAKNPEFYLVEVELEKHDFDRHIFPQIKRFFAFFSNSAARDVLIGQLFDFIKSEKGIESEFKKYLGGREIYKSLKDIIESSQNILLVIDEYKGEFDETSETITEWAKFVKVEVLKQYVAENEEIFTLNPDFEDVKSLDVDLISEEEKETGSYTEEFHKSYVDQGIVEIFEEIKSEIKKYDKEVIVNPQKYYISLKKDGNFAFIKIRRKKLHIVVMLPVETGEKIIKHHKITELAPSVQKFYNGSCFRVTVENGDNLKEITDLLAEAISKRNSN